MSQSVNWPLEFKVTLREKTRKSKNEEQWIFIHPNRRGDPDQLYKLPLSEFPITYKINRTGIQVTCVDGRKNQEKENNSVDGLLHRYDGTDMFKYARFYVYSAWSKYHRHSAKQQWQAFVQRFGVSRQHKPEKDLKLLIIKGRPGEPYIFKFVEL
jgi:hypothetical protein